jgi:hypothetical protein
VPVSQHPHNAISVEVDFQQIVFRSLAKFRAQPQEMLLALGWVGENRGANIIAPGELENYRDCLNGELLRIGLNPIQRPGEGLMGIVECLASAATRLDATVGEAATSEILHRAADVIRHDALSRYGPTARAWNSKRRVLPNETAHPSEDPKPDSLRLTCPRCGIALFLDRWYVNRGDESIRLSCRGCLAVFEYRNGVLSLDPEATASTWASLLFR